MNDAVIKRRTDAEVQEQLGSALRVVRCELGITLGQLARALAISTVYVSDVERGKTKLTPPELRQWLRALLSL